MLRSKSLLGLGLMCLMLTASHQCHRQREKAFGIQDSRTERIVHVQATGNRSSKAYYVRFTFSLLTLSHLKHDQAQLLINK